MLLLRCTQSRGPPRSGHTSFARSHGWCFFSLVRLARLNELQTSEVIGRAKGIFLHVQFKYDISFPHDLVPFQLILGGIRHLGF
jgi:hypothetical protein